MRVLVTGATSGLGAALSDALRARGDDVRGVDLQAAPGVLVADVRDQPQVDEAVETAIAELGGLDVLVNGAGIGRPQDAGSPPDDDALAILHTNLVGAWRVTGAALPALLRSRGRVVNVASGLAAITLLYSAAYTASKRALVGYSDVLRLEYGDRISVTTVYPGFIRTPIHRPSEEMGVFLGDSVPEDPMDRAVRALLRACDGRGGRELATSLRTRAALVAGRHFPRLTDAVVRWQMGRVARRGGLDGADSWTRAGGRFSRPPAG